MLFRCSVVGSLPWDIVLYELLQHGSFPWGAVLPELLWCVSPTVCSSCQDPAPTWALHRLQLPSGHIHLMQHWVLHGQKNGCLLACGLLQAARGCSTTRSSPWAAGESLLGLLEHLLPLLLHWAWCLHGCFTFFLTPLSQLSRSVFYPFINVFFQRCHHLGCGTQLCWAVGRLEPAGTGCVRPRAARATSLRPLQTPLPARGHLCPVHPPLTSVKHIFKNYH